MVARWIRRGMVTLMLAGAVSAPGCSSFRSELFSTDACSDQKKTKHLTGIPTTVDVPTHIKLVILEKRMFKKNAKDNTWERDASIPCSKDVLFDLVVMKELYTVNLKRPASGTINYDLTFLESDGKPTQRLKQLKTKTTDTTITDTAALIQTIIASTPTLASMRNIRLATQTVETGPPPADPLLVEMTGHVACDLFELRDPQLSERMREFLETYLNDCHACPFPRPGSAGTCLPKAH